MQYFSNGLTMDKVGGVGGCAEFDFFRYQNKASYFFLWANINKI